MPPVPFPPARIIFWISLILWVTQYIIRERKAVVVRTDTS